MLTGLFVSLTVLFAFLGFAKGAGVVCYFSGCISMYSFNTWSVSFGLLSFAFGLISLKLLLTGHFGEYDW